MNKLTICMLQSFNSRLDSVSSLRCFDAPAVFPTRRVGSEKAIEKNNGGKRAGESLQASFYTRQSAHYLFSEKTFLVSKWQLLKHQNVPCRRVSHTPFVISLSLRARSQAIRDFKIERRDGNENVTQKWICVLSVFITIIPTHLLCQM